MLPIYQTSSRDLSLMQTNWSTQLNPLLDNPSLQSIILKKVSLINGSTTINHLLGRKLQGWRIIRQRALASVYDNQDNNPTPQSTLILISNAAVTVDLEVL